MEIGLTSLGEFASLFVEIRERIWLNFLPRGEDSKDAEYPWKLDLNSSQTNITLCREIWSTLYGESKRKFELSPCSDAWLRDALATKQ